MSKAISRTGNDHLRALRPLLDASGLQWEAKPGKNHIKIFIGARLLMAISRGKGRSDPRLMENAKAVIRRAARELTDVGQAIPR